MSFARKVAKPLLPKDSRLYRWTRLIYRSMQPTFTTVALEYAPSLQPRWGYTQPPHSAIARIIEENYEIYRTYLESFLSYLSYYHAMPDWNSASPTEPGWNFAHIKGIDVVALYGLLVEHRPSHYVELGSGMSTRIARKAIRDHQLPTKIISIDPQPRIPVNALCDEVIRERIENIEPEVIIDRLGPGDILFWDGAHLAVPGTDAPLLMLEVLPFLRPGVLVHIHDIYWPYDYLPEMCERAYGEQYLLGTWLLGARNRYKILLPNYYLTQRPELMRILEPIWQHPRLGRLKTDGSSFWFEVL